MKVGSVINKKHYICFLWFCEIVGKRIHKLNTLYFSGSQTNTTKCQKISVGNFLH